MLSLSSPHLCQWHQRAANQEDLDSNCTSALNSLGCLKQVGLILSLSLPVCNMSENAVGLHSRVVVRIIIMHVKQFEHLNYIGRCGGYTGGSWQKAASSCLELCKRTILYQCEHSIFCQSKHVIFRKQKHHRQPSQLEHLHTSFHAVFSCNLWMVTVKAQG